MYGVKYILRIYFKEKISWIGFMVGSLTLIIIFLLFPVVFGDTPVNLLRLGSVSGERNYYINLFSFLLITTVLYGVTCLFIKEKVKWIVGGIFGICITALLLTVFIFSYFEIFWKAKIHYRNALQFNKIKVWGI